MLETIASGDQHACGIDSNGNAFCWGRNVFGQLGDGTEFSRSSPTPVATTLQFTALAGGGEFTCGRSTAGHVYCWGANSAGQLGIGGESPPKLTPRLNWIPVGVTTHVTYPAKGLITSLPTFPGLLIGQTFGVPDGQSIAFDRSSIGVVAQPNLGQVTAVEPLAGSSGPIIFGLIDPVDAIWAPSIDRLYIAEGLRGRVTARFGLTPSIVAVRTFAAPVRSLAFTRTLVMAALESGEVVSMEPQSLTPVASSFGGSGAAFVQAADDGTAFAINEGGALSHIGSDGFLLRTYPVDTGATAVSGSPAWNLAIVTHQAANRTSWVDLTTGVVELITVNFQPKRVEIDDQSGLAFVLTKTSVWMFDIPTRKLLYQVFAANTTGDLALIR